MSEKKGKDVEPKAEKMEVESTTTEKTSKKRKMDQIEKGKKPAFQRAVLTEEERHRVQMEKNARRKAKKRFAKESSEGKKDVKESAEGKKEVKKPKIERVVDEVETEAWNEIYAAKRSKNVVSFNKLMTQFGQKKRLNLALEAYNIVISTYNRTKTTERPRLKPTVYTFTSIINACVRCGDIKRAITILEDMKNYDVEPNEVTYTALIKGLCAEATTKEALEMLTRMKKESIMPNLRTYNTLLRGMLRSGDTEESLSLYREMIRRKVKPNGTSMEYVIRNLCQALRLEEAEKMMEEVDKAPAVLHAAMATTAAILGKYETARESVALARDSIGREEIGSQNTYDDDDSGATGTAGASGDAPKQSALLFHEHLKNEISRECDRVEEYIERVKGKKRKGQFPNDKIFVLNKKPSDELKSHLREMRDHTIKLEVCSGHGDWIVQRAQEEPDTQWVGLEMRYERVFQIWSRGYFHKLDNLHVIVSFHRDFGGMLRKSQGEEAHLALITSVPEATFEEVFVNYPDPPVWEGSPQKLVDYSFLINIYRVLKAKGSLTLVTDDKPYSQLMIKEIAKVPHLFRSAFGEEMFQENVPEGYGSSYFDRFWTNGRKQKRYFLKFNKI
ncbi:hypothetical protein PROFUN_04641 [Planoprotostelium fungivorum]|uniref:tRNA (guanine(46)-N(7))-methyltransferase n=1 Tax=Planoprotostelium fungivorum TaxID=1890364 RepID=A0A2P6NUH2_9EUKA|nr:hypothetical protein PROFUN_04641 [Planoprotostelium fungivorum]